MSSKMVSLFGFHSTTLTSTGFAGAPRLFVQGHLVRFELELRVQRHQVPHQLAARRLPEVQRSKIRARKVLTIVHLIRLYWVAGFTGSLLLD